MALVKVRLVAPEGRVFQAQIDEHALPEQVRDAFVNKLALGDPRSYHLHLVDAFSLADGVEIRIVESGGRSLDIIDMDD